MAAEARTKSWFSCWGAILGGSLVTDRMGMRSQEDAIGSGAAGDGVWRFAVKSVAAKGKVDSSNVMC
jgi:hypothetical protein